MSLKKFIFSLMNGSENFILNHMYLGMNSWSVMKTPCEMELMFESVCGLVIDDAYCSRVIESSILFNIWNTLRELSSGLVLSWI